MHLPWIPLKCPKQSVAWVCRTHQVSKAGPVAGTAVRRRQPPTQAGHLRRAARPQKANGLPSGLLAAVVERDGSVQSGRASES